jgi:CheY-like chemotaxis protein
MQEHEGVGPTEQSSAFQLIGIPTRRVLIVDDNRDAVDMEARLLKMLGQVVALAYDGPTALRIANDFKPEIVLMDLDMPGMTGFDVARHLSACPWMEGAHLVAYTGFALPRYRSAAIAAGFDDFIMKPVPLAQLLSILRGSAQDK